MPFVICNVYSQTNICEILTLSVLQPVPLQRPLQRRRNCRRLRLQVKHFCIGDIFTFAIFWNISYIFILATFPYLLHSYIGNIFKLAEFFHLIPFHICYIHFHLLSAESELTLLLSISWGQSKVEMSQHQFPWAKEDWKSISSCWVIIALGGPIWNHH